MENIDNYKNHYPYKDPCDDECFFCDNPPENFVSEKEPTHSEQVKVFSNNVHKEILAEYNIKDYSKNKTYIENCVYTEKDFQLKISINTLTCIGNGNYKVFLPNIYDNLSVNEDIIYNEDGSKDKFTFTIINLSNNRITIERNKAKEEEYFVNTKTNELYNNITLLPFHKVIVHKYLNLWKFDLC